MKIEKKETIYTVQFTEHEMVLLWTALDSDCEYNIGRLDGCCLNDDEEEECKQLVAEEQTLSNCFHEMFKR